jgi:hypothetical protein
MKEQKYHIYLTEQERSEVIKSLIDLKKRAYPSRQIHGRR